MTDTESETPNLIELPVGGDRTASVERRTGETSVRVHLALDGTGKSRLDTGIGFLDHMLTSLARHARLDLELAPLVLLAHERSDCVDGNRRRRCALRWKNALIAAT